VKLTSTILALILLGCATAFGQAPLDSRLTVIDPIIDDAIAQQQIPGAVLIIGHDGRVVYRKAYGSRAIEPQREAMTLDTVFDCASLTKVIATTSAIMQLWEKGKFRMNDPVAKYLPEFGQNGKQDITIRGPGFDKTMGRQGDGLSDGVRRGARAACWSGIRL